MIRQDGFTKSAGTQAGHSKARNWTEWPFIDHSVDRPILLFFISPGKICKDQPEEKSKNGTDALGASERIKASKPEGKSPGKSIHVMALLMQAERIVACTRRPFPFWIDLNGEEKCQRSGQDKAVFRAFFISERRKQAVFAIFDYWKVQMKRN